MSTKAGKRPLRSLSPNEKLEAIRRVHGGESKASVARDIGVPESTLRGWCKNEEKISYLSRQPSPETDESLDHSNQSKKAKHDDSGMQPFNLSLKSSPVLNVHSYSPNSEVRFGVESTYMKNETKTPKAPLNLNTKTETSKSLTHMTEQEKNRAELARLSVDLGLNRPEMFLPTNNGTSYNFQDLSAHIISHWNRVLLQQLNSHQIQPVNKNKISQVPTTDTSTHMTPSSSGLLTTVDQEIFKHLPKEKQPVYESVRHWLNQTHQTMLNINQNSTANLQSSNGISAPNTTLSMTPTTSMAGSNTPMNKLNGSLQDHNSWFWKWYKFSYEQYQQQVSQMPPLDNKPILYQQLTKETPQKDTTALDQQNAENLSIHMDKEKAVEKPIYNNVIHNNNNNKARSRSVLDNLLCNNNNVAIHQRDGKEDEESLSQTEAVEHGEKFLKWLEACSDPSVTAMQIMQFRTLLYNVKTGVNRKNSDLQNKTKVKRK